MEDMNYVQDTGDEIEIDLVELFGVIFRKMWIIILAGLMCALVGVAATMLLMKPEYKSTTKLVVLNKQDNNTITNSDVQSSTALTEDYAQLIKSRTVTERVIAELGLKNMTHEKLSRMISVDTPSDTRVISIVVTAHDPYEAAEIADTVREVASSHIQSVLDIEAVNVVDQANIPDEKSGPSKKKYGLLAGILGCLIAAIIVIINYLTNDTIKTEEDVMTKLHMSVLGAIPMSQQGGKVKKKRKAKRRRR